jgi:CubicO group peptidase (beta-lactamase class C family)
VVIDLAGGDYLERRSLTGVFSVTKGIAAIALATLVDTGRLDLDGLVTDYWPEFGAAGKDSTRVRELLYHQAGLPNTDPVLSAEQLLDSSLAAARLAATRPVWQLRSAFGYHGLTIGVFMEELVRRITGESLQHLYEREIRAPREIDFFLGLPEALEPRYRPVLPLQPTAAQQDELDSAPPSPDGVMALAFDGLPGGGSGVAAVLPHTRAGRAAGFSAVGGVGSARGIADVYATVLDDSAAPLLSRNTVERMTQEQVFGTDRVLNSQMAFASVFMKPQPRIPFASYRGFGHDGAGGALGFADPMYDLAFGYIPMPMQYPGGADPRAVDLSLLIRGCIIDAS